MMPLILSLTTGISGLKIIVGPRPINFPLPTYSIPSHLRLPASDLLLLAVCLPDCLTDPVPE